jgi:hypothetical protein
MAYWRASDTLNKHKV